MAKKLSKHSPKTAKNNKNLWWFDRWVHGLNLVSVFALLCTYPAPYISPATFWPLALLGLAYPLLLLLNVLFVVYWALRSKWEMFNSLFAILLGIPILIHTLGLQIVSPPAANSPSVQLMTYNVRNFDLYNWSNNKDARERIMQSIKLANPDIICFQEFYTETGEEATFDNSTYLTDILGYKYHNVTKTVTVKEHRHFGVAIFAKYPIIDSGKVKFENANNNIVTYTDLDVQGQRIRVFNVHLQSIHLSRDDLAYVKNIGNQNNPENEPDHYNAINSILNKLRTAYVKRSVQAQTLSKKIQDSPYPTLVCGDFNDTPSSYAYRTVAHNMNDAFLCTSFGMGGTYAGPVPALRIDYILSTKNINIHAFEIGKTTYSDHYPISCTFTLPANSR